MDIKEFASAKNKLEWELASLIQSEVSKFEEATGQTPRSISVYMVPLVSSQAFGRPDTKYLVGSVQVETPLG